MYVVLSLAALLLGLPFILLVYAQVIAYGWHRGTDRYYKDLRRGHSQTEN